MEAERMCRIDDDAINRNKEQKKTAASNGFFKNKIMKFEISTRILMDIK